MHPAQAGLHAGYDGQVNLSSDPLIHPDEWVHSVKSNRNPRSYATSAKFSTRSDFFEKEDNIVFTIT